MAYRFTYFTHRGKGEIIRQIFALAEEPYEDIRIPKDQWPQHKQKMPFGQVPVLEVDGETLAQSAAIGRFLARKFGYAGKTPIEMAKVDAIVDQFKDYWFEFQNYYFTFRGMREGNADEVFEREAGPAIKKFFGFMEETLKKNGTGYLVGDSVTWADLQVCEHMTTLAGMVPGVFAPYPEVRAWKERVDSIPQIAKWISSRPKTQF